MADPQYGAEHQQRRAEWDRHMRSVGPVTCGHDGCDRPVYPDPEMNWDGRTWHLGHGKAAKHGGTGTDSWPEHATCNEGDGYRISQDNGLTLRKW